MDTGADTAPSAPTSSPTADLVGRRAVRAVFVAFIGSGFAFASWASRIPQVRDRLDLDPRAARAGAAGHRRRARCSPCRWPARSSPASARGAPSWRWRCCSPSAWRHRRRRPPAGVVPVVVGAVPLGFANGAWDVAMNVAGRRRRAAARPLDHVPLPRRVQPRHGRRRAASARLMVALHVPVDRPPDRRRRAGRASASRSAVRGFLPDGRAAHRAEPSPGAPSRADGLAGAAHAADRAVRPRLRLRRGHRQRLDQRRAHRRLRRARRRSARSAFAVFLAP